MSAFQSFCDRAGRGQFPQLNGRDDLWRLLATLTARKAPDAMRHQARQERGGGRVLGESALLVGEDAGGQGLAEVPGREPAPGAAAQLADDYRRFLARLRLEGQSARGVAESPIVAARTVERKLQRLRAIRSQEAPR